MRDKDRRQLETEATLFSIEIKGLLGLESGVCTVLYACYNEEPVFAENTDDTVLLTHLVRTVRVLRM
jgi:hypothetical protein